VTRAARPPIGDAPRGLRQRLRSDGTWRVWWEPRAQDRLHGFAAVELSADRAAWSVAEARRLNKAADTAIATGTRPDAPARAGNRITDLIAAYRQSPDFRTGLAPKTQASYRALLNQIEEKWGTARVAEFDKATMKAWYETLYTHKGATIAQRLLRMMSILFTQAEARGMRPDNSNPCFRLRLHTPAPRARVATWAEVDAMISAAEGAGQHAMALAIRLGVFQGQRQTEVREATRGAFRLIPVAGGAMGDDGAPRPEWVWFFRRSKRGNDGVMPLHAEVVPHLRRALADTGTPAAPRRADAALLVDEALGRAYDEDLFQARWRALRTRAAATVPSVADLQFRDLRRTFGVLARAGGSSKNDIGDVLGNSAATNPLLGETYMPPSFATTRRTIGAIQRPVTGEGKSERDKG